MPNQSKIKDPRFWKKWRESGAVSRLVKWIPIERAYINTIGDREDWCLLIMGESEGVYYGQKIAIENIPRVLQGMGIRRINAHDPDGSFLRKLGIGYLSLAEMDRERKFPYFEEIEGRLLPLMADSRGAKRLALTTQPPRYK